MSEILNRGRSPREYFEPTNKKHLESLKVFLRTGNWGTVQFYPELPYIEVPTSVLMKFALHTLKVQAETVAERSARIASMALVQPAVAETDVEHTAHLKEVSQWLKTSGAENWPL